MAKKHMTVAEAGRLGGSVKGSCKARSAESARRSATIRWLRWKLAEASVADAVKLRAELSEVEANKPAAKRGKAKP